MHITDELKTLMDQAPMTILVYYSKLEEWFDKKYGKGWTEKHSDAVSRLALAAALDFNTMATNRSLQDIREQIGLLNVPERVTDLEYRELFDRMKIENKD